MPEDQDFARQRHEWSAVELPTSSGEALILRPGQGALMGDQYAVKGFLHTYERPIRRWHCTEPSRQDPDDALWFEVESPIMPNVSTALCDLSLSHFADDVDKFILAAIGSTLTMIINAASSSMQAFDEVVKEYVYTQNNSKLIAVTALHGTGSQKMLQEINASSSLPFRCSQSALSLGVTVCHDISAQAEVGARLSAIRRA